VLEPDVLDPVELDVAPDGRVFFIEIGGRVKVHQPQSGMTTLAGQLSVYTGVEHGLLGLALDPNFATNHWLYLFYSPAGPETVQRVSRFTVVGDHLNLQSEKVLLTIPTTRLPGASHEAGSLAFGPGGELYISTGDDTNPFESSGYAPIDERPGRLGFDAQKSASNANDLRGKILRIKPEADGSYSIPVGNLFPADGSAGRPEIFVMGSRNPYRISVDAETGWLYWGDIGPDALVDDAARGPRGYDELNQARTAGNYGWPYFVADNKPYRNYDFATGISGPAFDPAAPTNDSPNNTGSEDLPPARGAIAWYPYDVAQQFPEFGSGQRTIMAGPVYHFQPQLASSRKLPAYFDDTLFIYDWSRNWVKEVKLDGAGNILKINPFAPQISLAHPIDLDIGPDGSLYVLEWGSQYAGGNVDAQLVRINFVGEPRIDSADFDGNGITDGADFLRWQRALGAEGGATRANGDANRDGAVSAADLAIWRETFGEGNRPVAATEVSGAAATHDEALAATSAWRAFLPASLSSGRPLAHSGNDVDAAQHNVSQPFDSSLRGGDQSPSPFSGRDRRPRPHSLGRYDDFEWEWFEVTSSPPLRGVDWNFGDTSAP
jgi:cytochrome c